MPAQVIAPAFLFRCVSFQCRNSCQTLILWLLLSGVQCAQVRPCSHNLPGLIKRLRLHTVRSGREIGRNPESAVVPYALSGGPEGGGVTVVRRLAAFLQYYLIGGCRQAQVYGVVSCGSFLGLPENSYPQKIITSNDFSFRRGAQQT